MKRQLVAGATEREQMLLLAPEHGQKLLLAPGKNPIMAEVLCVMAKVRSGQ